MENKYIKASIFKRGAAFVIDAIMAFLPALVIYIIFTGTYYGLTPLYYPAPIIGVVSMADLPATVNERISNVTTDEGGVVTTHNFSTLATAQRMVSVLVIVFYIAYSAFCTAVYDGRTIGKKFMRLRVVPEDDTKPMKSILMREVLGKIIINSTVIVPVISLITILVTKKGKAIHDFIGNTRVVEE